MIVGSMKEIYYYSDPKSNYIKSCVYVRRKHSEDRIDTHKLDLTIVGSERSSVVLERPLLNERSIALLNEDLHEDRLGIDKAKAIIGGFAGLGTGLAMMPIFNREVKELDFYGLDIHASESLFITSTLNTLFFTSISNGVSLYDYITSDNHTTSAQKAILTVAGISSSLIPLSMLWNIELHNQEVNQSKGFDKFIAYASISTIPLLILKLVECYELIEKVRLNKFELESTGDKLINYGINTISFVARGISYKAITSELAHKMGFDEKSSEALGVIVGGLLANSVSAITEHLNIKSMFKKSDDSINKKQFLIGMLSAIEGLWFSLPTVTAGLRYTSNWNPLFKGILFVPYLISKGTTETLNLYKTFYNQQDHKIDRLV